LLYAGVYKLRFNAADFNAEHEPLQLSGDLLVWGQLYWSRMFTVSRHTHTHTQMVYFYYRLTWILKTCHLFLC